MSFKQPAIALVAAALFSVAGLASASAQENCGHMYQRVMEADQTQSPHYGGVLNHYNARCLSGSSMQPVWSGETSDTALALPDSVALAPGRAYFWRVDGIAEGLALSSGARQLRVR